MFFFVCVCRYWCPGYSCLFVWLFSGWFGCFFYLLVMSICTYIDIFCSCLFICYFSILLPFCGAYVFSFALTIQTQVQPRGQRAGCFRLASRRCFCATQSSWASPAACRRSWPKWIAPSPGGGSPTKMDYRKKRVPLFYPLHWT